MIRAIAVVVPAHDEQDLLPRCLASLRLAAGHAGLPPVHVVVVADACVDRTAEVALAAGARVCDVEFRNAGAARRHGFEVALDALGPAATDVWLATTDADSEVPTTWFADQLRCHAGGWDAVAGTVEVRDWAGHPPRVAARFVQEYAWTGEGLEHPHVHGANLSLSGAAYLAVGGFPALALAEDHALVAALEARGLRVARSTAAPVVTSARTDPRARGGFGDLLISLAH